MLVGVHSKQLFQCSYPGCRWRCLVTHLPISPVPCTNKAAPPTNLMCCFCQIPLEMEELSEHRAMYSHRDESHLTELQLRIVQSVQCPQTQYGKFKTVLHPPHTHTQSHIWRHRRHFHQNHFCSAGGLSCRKLSNKGINKAWTRCSLSRATGPGCTPEWAMPSADLCQTSHDMHQTPYWNLLVQILWSKIFRKNRI